MCIPLAPPKVCIILQNNLLTLTYKSGDKVSFNCVNPAGEFASSIIQKQIDTSFGGKKRLNTLAADIAISSKSAQRSSRDIILSDKDMDTVFNLVPVGTEVTTE